MDPRRLFVVALLAGLLIVVPIGAGQVTVFMPAGSTDEPLFWGDEATAVAASSSRGAGSGFTVDQDMVTGQHLDFRLQGGQGLQNVRMREGASTTPLLSKITLDRTIPISPETPGLTFVMQAPTQAPEIRIEAHDHPGASISVSALPGIAQNLEVTLEPAQGLAFSQLPGGANGLALAGSSGLRGTVVVFGDGELSRSGSVWIATLTESAKVTFLVAERPGAPDVGSFAAHPPALVATVAHSGTSTMMDLARSTPWSLEAGRDPPGTFVLGVSPPGPGSRGLWLAVAGIAGPGAQPERTVAWLDGEPMRRLDPGTLSDEPGVAGLYTVESHDGYVLVGLTVEGGRESEVMLQLDEDPPFLESQQVTLRTSTRIVVEARYSELALGTIRIAPQGGAPVEQTADRPAFVQEFDVSGFIEEATTYTYTIRIEDLGGNIAESQEFQVLTPASSAFPAPEMVALHPEAGSRVEGVPERLGAEFRAPAGEAIDTGFVRLDVDGVEVTGLAQVTATSVFWEPGEMEEGEHTARVEVVTERGGVLEREWSFTVEGRGAPLPLWIAVALLGAAWLRRRGTAKA